MSLCLSIWLFKSFFWWRFELFYSYKWWCICCCYVTFYYTSFHHFEVSSFRFPSRKRTILMMMSSLGVYVWSIKCYIYHSAICLLSTRTSHSHHDYLNSVKYFHIEWSNSNPSSWSSRVVLFSSEIMLLCFLPNNLIP